MQAGPQGELPPPQALVQQRRQEEEELWREEGSSITSNRTVVTAPVMEVRFTYDTIGYRFWDGRRFDCLVSDLEHGRVDPMTHEFLQLEAGQQLARGPRHPAVYWCKNNRCFPCLQEFQRRNPHQMAQVRLIVEAFTGTAGAFTSALTTVNSGKYVEERRKMDRS